MRELLDGQVAAGEELRRAIATHTISHGKHGVEITASVGAVLAPPETMRGGTPQELLRVLVTTLNQARNSGGNQLRLLVLVPSRTAACPVTG